MKCQKVVIVLSFVIVIFVLEDGMVKAMSLSEKRELKLKLKEMFFHAYNSYMDNAYPADELMPLSCKGRYRGSQPNRGDIDDSLGNFTLTLIDTLDTLAVLGEVKEFDKAVKLVVSQVTFDTDVVVSVFETNIRVLGGLLGGHVLASSLKKRRKGMEWYTDELLLMAKDIGYRLLPAFNTSTGIPYPRVNLRHGIRDMINKYKDTCTACAGTMVLEFAALSRLTGESIFEEKAHKAMDYLWEQRHRSSDLVGTVINIHNGDWVRRESGVGAGIDSYYEYVLKAYILLGDDEYLDRFNKHYSAVMKYISQGPLLVDVHMHKPEALSRHFMDSLLAFWPGLQVLKGDIRPAIQTHQMLYQVMQKHNFLPEGFTSDFRVHWGNHPLRPELIESTYFLYKATGDNHYLEVGKKMMENLDAHARVPCGFAAIKDVTSGAHEDQLDSYVFAETFKYLYLLFAEKSDLIINVDDYLFTTEAHLLPLSLSVYNYTAKVPKIRREVYESLENLYDEDELSATIDISALKVENTCQNPQYLATNLMNYATKVRGEMKGWMDKSVPVQSCSSGPRLKAADFIAGNKAQLQQLHDMGIRIATMADGRIQLLHSAADAASVEDAENGMKFMQEMIELSSKQPQDAAHEPMVVQVITEPYYGTLWFKAGPAQFGYNLKTNPPVQGPVVQAVPYKACTQIENADEVKNKIAVIERGDCMFNDKARNLQKAGAIGGIVIDHTKGSTVEGQLLFAMSGDGTQDVKIPMVFLFHKEGHQLFEVLLAFPETEVLLAHTRKSEGYFRPDGVASVTSQPKSPPTSAKGPSRVENVPKVTVRVIGDKVTKTTLQDGNDETIISDGSGNTVYYKYQAGTNKIFMNVKVNPKDNKKPEIPVVTDDDVIVITTRPDGSKQLSFNFDHISAAVSESVPQLNQIYQYVVDIMKERTNFNSLDNQADYLTAVARILESAYFNTGSFDSQSQRMFDKLASVLELKKKDTVSSEQKSTTVLHDSSQTTDSLPSYASEGDLNEEFENTEQSSELESESSNEKPESIANVKIIDENGHIKYIKVEEFEDFAQFTDIDDYVSNKRTDLNNENVEIDRNENLGDIDNNNNNNKDEL
ncbi:ER degradation-enhancing alpha-mannosidase-like protein 3 [Mytilus californianus]|uniref:ER degradation-enhancing alpha-mannosidase-like protein 3 n=1 Tax=Mytilus californianus TaxID=6549 RepID=UPI0022480626|nr:ER degradation-enhancing alpha-mannosidase-like protein 3 [Mytilus californianus]XP_052093111.1 ER degradation-enhancing alpha-mannosidase-like protein 3 [Mytilus californianus]XP_052093112.1 ER degradation-enhancing alpha-mannosidase-like protein 3 [Mytilus californianus]XP_052093113.1 ER degradation-enhancing alpha-mannosidase-like protein 3 [Mytilus californianus]XP_052093114.1 ER degradation-enhancing alpha-mannosidase-like protein 3 [Mytilus californianus]XP_052093115.1 ER degradation-